MTCCASFPDRRGVARQGPGGHRRGAAIGPSGHRGDIQDELASRRFGFGRGPRMRFEVDELTLLGGIRHGRTLGRLWRWRSPTPSGRSGSEEMSPAPGQTAKPLTQPRPGHADLAGMQKYGFTDARDVLERAAPARPRPGSRRVRWPRLLLAEMGIGIVSHVVQMGPVASKCQAPGVPRTSRRWTIPRYAASIPRRKRDGRGDEAAAKDGDSLGGSPR